MLILSGFLPADTAIIYLIFQAEISGKKAVPIVTFIYSTFLCVRVTVQLLRFVPALVPGVFPGDDHGGTHTGETGMLKVHTGKTARHVEGAYR